MAFLGPTQRHRLFSPSGYNIPKPKFMYYVNFVTTYLDENLLRSLSFFVKRIDRIQLQYEVQEMNQYNKKRLVQNKIVYGPLNIAFHDTADDAALKMIDAYNRFYYGDFDNKNNRSWAYDVVTSNFEFTGNWGLKNNFRPNDGYFFDRIEIFEIYDQGYSQVNFINPKFLNVDFQNLEQEAGIGNEINITTRYEGLVVDKINEPMTAEIADRFGLPFNDSLGISVNGFRIPGLANLIPGIGEILSSTQNVFSNLVNAPTFRSLSGTVLENILLPTSQPVAIPTNNAINVFGTSINSLLAGRVAFDSLAQTSNLLPGVESRINAGSIVRDISTASVGPASLINLKI